MAVQSDLLESFNMCQCPSMCIYSMDSISLGWGQALVLFRMALGHSMLWSPGWGPLAQPCPLAASLGSCPYSAWQNQLLPDLRSQKEFVPRNIHQSCQDQGFLHQCFFRAPTRVLYRVGYQWKSVGWENEFISIEQKQLPGHKSGRSLHSHWLHSTGNPRHSSPHVSHHLFFMLLS